MKNLLFLVALFLFASSLMAQNNRVRYGVKAGVGAGKIAILPLLQNRTEHYDIGVVAGGVIEIPVQKKWKVQIEPLYNMHLSSVKFDPYTEVKQFDLTLHQVSLPVQLGYFITPKLSVNAGGSVSYNFYFTQKVTVEFGANPTFNITEEITKFQPGLLGGLTFYATDNVFLDGRYHRMLTNSYKRPPGDNHTEYRLGAFQMTFGYRF